ncbi:gamma-glutamylcyclotransferase family protein [Bradyrhizobium japonicum]|uniref:gamma-glutamylcyclotransferase family protein n=1 Tax=Bradyrhizobium japonicum TaxID=375 RepID=UPI001379168A
MYQTVEPFPLVIAGPWFAPMMFNEPGRGHRVFGEVYRIDVGRLQKLDRLESLGKPGNFRVAIEVVPLGVGQPVRAFVYLKSRELAGGAYHSDLLETTKPTDLSFLGDGKRPRRFHGAQQSSHAAGCFEDRSAVSPSATRDRVCDDSPPNKVRCAQNHRDARSHFQVRRP